MKYSDFYSVSKWKTFVIPLCKWTIEERSRGATKQTKKQKQIITIETTHDLRSTTAQSTKTVARALSCLLCTRFLSLSLSAMRVRASMWMCIQNLSEKFEWNKFKIFKFHPIQFIATDRFVVSVIFVVMKLDSQEIILWGTTDCFFVEVIHRTFRTDGKEREKFLKSQNCELYSFHRISN